MSKSRAGNLKVSGIKPVRSNRSSPLWERLREGVGVLLAVAAAYLLLVLVTYSSNDPSFSNATPLTLMHNLGGKVGAYTSDALIMLFGLMAYLSVAWLAYHAFNLITHREGPSFNLQVVTVPLFLISACALAFCWPRCRIGRWAVAGLATAACLASWWPVCWSRCWVRWAA